MRPLTILHNRFLYLWFMLKKLVVLLLCFAFSPKAIGQETNEVTQVDFLKSIHFLDENPQRQFPIIGLNESFTLVFDDLLAQDNDYYYRIKHFNADWSPSDLFPNQYLKGFDNLRLDNFRSSFNTLQRYTHYELTLPNTNTSFLVSGNYMIEIYNAYDELMFSRKFLVFENTAQVQLGIYPTQNIDRLTTSQNLQFSIRPLGFQIRNPTTDLKVVMLQNHQWNSARQAPAPQYTSGNQLIYRYDLPTQYYAGNEYLFFNTKDLRVLNPSVSYVGLEELYQHYLYTDAPRKGFAYTYFPDINGNFVVETLQGDDQHTEADYSEVYFSLARQYGLNDEEIYIYGKFNNYALSEENKMVYNPNLELYEGILLLKQGFYNYNYVRKVDGELDKISISDTHAQTENNYLVLVYHRSIGSLYDALIGVGEQQSFSLQR